MAIKKQPLLDRINNFFVKNWFLNGVSNIIIICLLIFYITEENQNKKDTDKRLNTLMMNIIYGTPDGRVGLLDKKLINTDSEVFQNHIALIAKNLETSEEKITHGFDPAVSAKLTNSAKLVEVDENFALLYKEFFASKRITMSVLKYYFILLKSGELAKKSSIISTKYEYEPDGENGFKMKIIFKTAKDFINKVDNKPIELIANDIVYLKGFIDPTKYSTPLNPFGVKFTDVKLNIYTYSDYLKSKG